jgi:hypothetical protein
MILSYGTVAGLIVGVFGFSVALNGHLPSPYGMVVGYLTMLIALSAVFVAIKKHRDADLGGVIRFWPAFGLGLSISVVASIFYVLAWEATVAVTQMDFAGDYARLLIDEQKAKGVSGDELAKFTAEMERFKTDYANPLFRLPMTFAEIFPVGLLVSLVSAGLLRNSRFLPMRRATPADASRAS